MDAQRARKIVRLSPGDFRWAVRVGAERQIRAVLGGYDSSPEADGWRHNVEGAVAERAVAQALEAPWHGSVDLKPGGREPDVLGLEVRWVPHAQNPMLCIKPSDFTRPDGSPSPKGERTFVLVTGVNHVKTIYGHMRGVDARQDRWWTEGRKNWDQKRLCWAVPYWHLQQLYADDFPHWRPPTPA